MKRLNEAPRASSFDEALRQLSDILNTVEDEMTDIPYDPDTRRPDGRLYPPREDSIRDVPAYPRVRRLRSRAHNTFIGENGSIEIADSDSGVPPAAPLFKKPGADGRTVLGQAE